MLDAWIESDSALDSGCTHRRTLADSGCMVRKEIFGTVVPLAEFHDLDEAIALTNESDY